MKTLGGRRYVVTFIDDTSIKAFVILMKQKSEVADIFNKWRAAVELVTGKRIKTMHSDKRR